MSNHPNRGRKDAPGANPTKEEIAAAREKAGMTQTEAAAVIFCSLNAWQQWEAGDRRMHPAFWELWKLKVAKRERAAN